MQRHVVAELVVVLLCRLLQPQVGHVDQQRLDVGVAPAAPVGGNLRLPFGLLLPVVAALNPVDGRPHIADHEVWRWQPIVAYRLLDQRAMATGDIRQGDLIACHQATESLARRR